MEESFDIKSIEKAFERIITNKVFKRSSLQERILRYLIDQALAGNDVTEHSIGIELFKEKYDAEKNDSKVRVYVFYLRKKLAEYYSGSGLNEEIIFHVEKGHYNLTFKQKEIISENSGSSKFIQLCIPKRSLFIALFLVVAILASTFLFQKLTPTYLWKPFFSKNENTICVIADHYMVSDTSRSNTHIYSNYQQINSVEEQNKFNIENPSAQLISSGFTLTTKMASFGVNYLCQWFSKNNCQFEVQLESETQYADYAKSNIIYIGQSKTMMASRSIFLSKSKAFILESDGFTYKDENGIIQYKAKRDKIDNQEYAMVSFQKLENGKHALFFTSNHDIGVMATLKLFTSKEQLKTFYKELPRKDVEFNALFKVSGLKRTEMGCELVELEIVE